MNEKREEQEEENEFNWNFFIHLRFHPAINLKLESRSSMKSTFETEIN